MREWYHLVLESEFTVNVHEKAFHGQELRGIYRSQHVRAQGEKDRKTIPRACLIGREQRSLKRSHVGDMQALPRFYKLRLYLKVRVYWCFLYPILLKIRRLFRARN